MKTNGALGAADGVSRGKTPANARGQRGVRDGASLSSLLRERDWQEVVVAYARIKGWLVYWTWRSVHSPAGYPDLCLVRGDRLVFVELKAENGKVSPDQARWIEALSSVPGVEVMVWRPSQWVDVRDTLL